ncbi:MULTISPECIES: type IV secretion system protein [Rhizobium]|uniref:type IV secretion system protein n=1 Tax=Rhizobium TaxID=379 RepID=UPI001C83B28D|nr:MULTISPECIES: type IV secretion system protein [Rhizobium]MBX4899645.1 type IV secretion system protein [Rhizobium bangladeshense]MBX5297563.1 type IV secretion system protein [Rhizobium sp. NLR15a]MBY3617823.1 type IV secretion system protein [Rhizobium bangladeshense]
MPAFSLPAPFTFIHLLFEATFSVGLEAMLGDIQGIISAPMSACVTLWIIVQGVLVMRGEVDVRAGITRIAMVTIVTALVLGQADYHRYVVTTFEETIPGLVRQLGTGLPLETIPTQLDLMFAASEGMYQRIAVEIGPMDHQEQLAFQGAKWILYGSLWLTFGIYDAISILTEVLIAIGPLMLIGYLFQFTRPITESWIKQLIQYALLLLLINIVATIVIATEGQALRAMLAVIMAAGTTPAKVIGLYELDMLFLTGNALIVALPTMAATIAGGYVSSSGDGSVPTRVDRSQWAAMRRW